MAKYINAAEAAERVAEATGINIADLLDILREYQLPTLRRCGRGMNDNPEGIDLYCYHCGARMDGGDSDAAD
jgi:hypothetical protein